MSRFLLKRALLVVAAAVFTGASPSFGQGIMVPLQGPVSRSMGGASTATPLDAIGSVYWNPASTTALQSELSVGFGLMFPEVSTSSSIPLLGSGTTDADPGVTPIPNVGWVHRPENSCFTYGLGILAVAGFKSNFPADPTNPIFLPQSNTVGIPGGFGRVYTEAQFLEIVPTIAYQVNDCLSIGGGPTITLGTAVLDPLPFVVPDDADGSGVPRYPSGRGTQVAWGGGFQVAAYYTTLQGWNFGATFKSPQWMEDFEYNTENELGLPRSETVSADLPMIVSVGASYTGIEYVILSMDVRYYDYANTEGVEDSGFRPDGKVRGLGWDSIFGLALGAQAQLTDCITGRIGYTYNESPIPEDQTFFNFATPLFYKHRFHIGASCTVSEAVSMHLAYSRVFETENTGRIFTVAGPIPGSSITSKPSGDTVSVGVTVRY